MSRTDRIDGLTEGIAVKAPVKVATTANITLSGVQTIDGVALTADETPRQRVLVKDQTDDTENGIYDVNSGAWTRSPDFDGSRDAVNGTQVLVNEGSDPYVKSYYLSATNPVDIGTDSLTFDDTPGYGFTLDSDPSPSLIANLSLGGYGIQANDLNFVSDVEIAYIKGLTSAIQTQFDAKVNDTGNETIAGVKTFSSFPVTPSSAPTTDYQAANKKYVNDEIAVLRFTQKALFEHVNDTDIYLSAGRYYHEGTTTQNLYWESKLTYSFANLGTSDWSYLYLDDSAIVTADTNVITATELIDSVTEPTWDVAKGGWYNGNDLCIFAVLTDGDDDLLVFLHDGGDMVQYAPAIKDVDAADIDTTWTDATLTIPSFVSKALVAFQGNYSGSAGGDISWRKNGSSDAGNVAVNIYNGNPVNSVPVFPDSGGIIEVVMENSTASTLTMYTNGWYFPKGM